MTTIPMGANPSRHSAENVRTYDLIDQVFVNSRLPVFEKLEAFPRFASKRSIARFLVKHELFTRVVGVNGSVVECGVFNGAGLFTWAQLSNIYEPVNYTRKIVGFDTFAGFPRVGEEDKNTEKTFVAGDLKGDTYEALLLSVEKYNDERALKHIPNIELIRGDFFDTGKKWLNDNPHALICLLYLDFDLYEPTSEALKLFLPRMPRGAAVCFDELNCANFPGETTAMLEHFDLRKYEIRRFPIDPWISYIVL